MDKSGADAIEEFEQRVNRTLVNMDAKLSHLQGSMSDFKSSFDEFKDEMGDFVKFAAEYIRDHEERIVRLEKNARIDEQ